MPTLRRSLAALLLLVAFPFCPALAHREADVQLDVLDVIVDAPWRVQRRPGLTEVPVLFFFPEVKAEWKRVRVKALKLADSTGSADVTLYEHRAGQAPVIGASALMSGEGLRLQDAWGRIAPDVAVIAAGEPAHAAQVGEVTDANRGWHVILRLPLPAALGASARTRIALAGSVEIENLEKPDGKTHVVRRRLEIDVDPDPLPMLPGWRTYDTHVHTLAEYDPNTSVKALRKNHGGPIRMLAETAASLGMIDSPEQIRDRVMVTDHNCYFSDRVFPRVGPTVEGLLDSPVQVLHPEWSGWFKDAAGKPILEGQREFENYDRLFGSTRGEEISIAKSPGALWSPIGALAAHLIVHGARHFCGPFHGGKFLMWREPNDNTIERVLTGIAGAQQTPRAFAYAAHPFTESDIEKRFGTYWNDEQVGYVVRSHVVHQENGRDRDFVFKGFQIWNQKDDRSVDMTLHDRVRMRKALEDPRREAAWGPGNPNWDHVLNFGLQRWHQLVCESFNAQAPARPAVRFVRKLFAAGGSDAHADFNRYSDCAGRGFASLPFPLDRLMKGFTVGSNAFAKVRIAVDAQARDGRSADEQALHGYAHGHGAVTDGPVLELEVDADGHFDQSRLAWSPRPQFRESDGQMGGDGWMDGARTALVAVGSARPMLRFRWRSSPQFGGPLTKLELYRDEPGKTVKRVEVVRNTGKAWVLAADGALDPATPAGPDGWRVVSLESVRGPDGRPTPPVATPSALSLGGFTDRLPTPPFDFRCYTNPVWLLPVAAGIAIDPAARAAGGRVPPGALRATFRFPVSMEEAPLEVRLIPLDGSGASVGAGVVLEPELWSASPRETIASSVFTAVNKTAPIDLTVAAARRFCLALIGPRDTHGNRLNSLAWVVEVAP